MYPYTAASIQEKESGVAFDESADISVSPSAKASTTPVISAIYELVGIVVHSGQANAGHYYSFIKERRYVCSSSTPPCMPFFQPIVIFIARNVRLIKVHTPP